MPSDDEFAVAGGLLTDPERCAPVAWLWCQPSDLTDERLRFAFEGVVSAWLAGMQAPGERFTPILVAHVASRFTLSLDDALAWHDDLTDEWGWASARHVYEWHAQRLGARGGLGRATDTLGRWYMRLRPLTIAPPHEATLPTEALRASPRDVRALLARLLRDLRAARRQAVEPPQVHKVERRTLDPW